MAAGTADLDGYVLPALGPLQTDHPALGVHGDPVPRDQRDPVLRRLRNRGSGGRTPPSADAGPAIPAASATAVAVATVAAHALLTCLRKVPPSGVPGELTVTRPGVVSHACAHPRIKEYAEG
ncbi:hypothetical protein SHKM778_12440 [Streptomyces sp. KM77-8]|uniref:Uncharacterized protein n=1 Tax=Streptomyces haneummycinicus TaxID=3074435 RepID=A0AAT9HBT7_9ACTN